MSAENNNPNKLDKSIDLGMDQFGRFAKRRWFWLIVLSIILWYFVVQVAPQLSVPSPGTIFQYTFQIIFYMFAIVLQFVALFWFLGRPRLYWVMPGETGVGFEDYKGNPEVLEAAKRIVLLLRGIEEYQEMGGQPVRGLLLSGPPGTGKSYLAQCISTEAGVPFAYASAASFRSMFIGSACTIRRDAWLVNTAAASSSWMKLTLLVCHVPSAVGDKWQWAAASLALWVAQVA